MQKWKHGGGNCGAAMLSLQLYPGLPPTLLPARPTPLPPPHLVYPTLTPAPPHLALGFAEVWGKIALWDHHDIHPYSSPNLDLFFSRVAVKKKNNNNKLGIYQAADQ